MLTGNEVRERFIEFFRKNGHEVVKSSPVVPHNDPTLLFVNAGMVQFKNVFLGSETRSYTRAVSSQKCIRVSGKHNDLSQVGRTPRHHTFFEMLGNFSFGDYFKKEAVQYHWELLTNVLGIPEEKLVATVYEQDDEAYNIWKHIIGLDESRIYRLGEKENFWSMGDTGPCGPCSEIIYDFGEGTGCGRPECDPSCDCGRFLELANLVFMQFNRDEKGNMNPLPRPSIDTGSGLERIASVLQDKTSNYDTDLIYPIIGKCSEIIGKPYRKEEEEGFYFRVIADHLRAAAFMIADNIYPSNEWQGYVLRRLMRRAITHGLFLGREDPFLYELVPTITGIMGDAYPEVREREEFIMNIIRAEEEGFGLTLQRGLDRLDDMLDKMEESGLDVLPGDFCFKLSDTDGIPIDVIEEIAGKRNIGVDRKGFDTLLDKQRHKSRESAKVGSMNLIPDSAWVSFSDASTSVFTGYDTLTEEGIHISAYAEKDDRIFVVLDRTPFYAESGGQVGDKGHIRGDGFELEVEDTTIIGGKTTHICSLVRGRPNGNECIASVDESSRRSTERNHTSTHLLQAALRKIIGTHVTQAGSLVTPGHLRFDFTHFAPLSNDEIIRIEDLVNDWIMENHPVVTSIVRKEEAESLGAMALFGEKYENMVRMVEVEGVSRELCGGTHVRATGEIGVFKIDSESGIAAGVRRIEAFTGKSALGYFRNIELLAEEASSLLKTIPPNLPDKIKSLNERLKHLSSENRKLARKLASGESSADGARMIAGLPFIITMIEAPDMETLREMADHFRQKGNSGLLGALVNGKPVFCVFADSKAIEMGLHAGKMAGKFGRIAGGGGGGRNDFAQGGAADDISLKKLLVRAPSLFEQLFSNEKRD